MPNEPNQMPYILRENINGCDITLRFSDDGNKNTKSERAVMDILMSAFEDRVHDSKNNS